LPLPPLAVAVNTSDVELGSHEKLLIEIVGIGFTVTVPEPVAEALLPLALARAVTISV